MNQRQSSIREALPKEGSLTEKVAELLRPGDEVYFSPREFDPDFGKLPVDSRFPFTNPQGWYTFIAHRRRTGTTEIVVNAPNFIDFCDLFVDGFGDSPMSYKWFSQYRLNQG